MVFFLQNVTFKRNGESKVTLLIYLVVVRVAFSLKSPFLKLYSAEYTMTDVEKEPEKTIAEDLVVTKYKLAGEIVNSEFLDIQRWW